MNDDLKNYIRQWFLIADHDLTTAKTILHYEPMITDTACFHCQQAVEKYLKAFLIYKGATISKTHSIDFLLKQCKAIDAEFDSIEENGLDDFAVTIRYPDDYIAPELYKAQDYLSTAEKVKELVLKKVDLQGG